MSVINNSIVHLYIMHQFGPQNSLSTCTCIQSNAQKQQFNPIQESKAINNQNTSSPSISAPSPLQSDQQ